MWFVEISNDWTPSEKCWPRHWHSTCSRDISPFTTYHTCGLLSTCFPPLSVPICAGHNNHIIFYIRFFGAARTKHTRTSAFPFAASERACWASSSQHRQRHFLWGESDRAAEVEPLCAVRNVLAHVSECALYSLASSRSRCRWWWWSWCWCPWTMGHDSHDFARYLCACEERASSHCSDSTTNSPMRVHGRAANSSSL